jgi:hypothetical protein
MSISSCSLGASLPGSKGLAACVRGASVSVKTLEELDEIVPGACWQRLGIDASGEGDGDAKLVEVGGAIGTGAEVAFKASTVASAE